jgi:hypothetical protein
VIAKFASGAETFHAAMHAVFWLSGGAISVFGIELTPTLNIVGAVVNGVIALLLGVFAWAPRRRTT